MKVVALYNGKGGVGKTTAAVNLAHLGALAGQRTLLWDLDPQAAATYLFRVKPRVRGGSGKLVCGRPLDGAIKGTDFDGLDLMPADLTYRHMDIHLSDTSRPGRQLRRMLSPLAQEYDLVVLDTPPGMSLVSENVLHASDLMLVPLVPAALPVRAFERLTELAGTLTSRRARLRAFFSMVDRRKSSHRVLVEQLSSEREDVSSVAVPVLSLVEQMAARRAPVTAYAPRSVAARAYETLWAEVETYVTAS